MQHIYEAHTNCEQAHCPICDGGLAHCTVCGAFEGSLTTDCPGYRVGSNIGDAVYAGQLDFRDGQWVAV